MNNLSNSLDYNIQQYTTLSQTPMLDSTPIQQQKQSQTKEPTMNQLQDPHFLNYQAFPLLRMTPPQLHQPTIAKEPAFNVTEKTCKNSTPIRITRPPNAYLLFNKEMRKILKEQDPTMKVADISKEVGLRWKTIPQAQKEHYVNQANQLKEEQRALHPNSMYIRRSRAELVKAGHFYKRSSGGGEQVKRRRVKREKSSAIPKHPLSAYMWYLTEVRPETMRRFPGSNVGQISKLCAERWNTMTEEQRLPWKTKAQVDKERYAREMQVYAIQNDHHLGRGTRQKYRSAALKSDRFMEFNSMISAPTSPSSILHNALLVHDSTSHSNDPYIVNN